MPHDHDSSSSSHARASAIEADSASHPDQAREKKVEYLTAHQLAQVLQVSEGTIHRLRRAGRIPAVLLTDRLIRFNLKDVQKALRPAHASPGEEGDAPEREPSPQLSFEDVFSEFKS